MSDPWLVVAIFAILAAFALFDIYAYGEFRRAARIHPRRKFLSLLTGVLAGISIAATIAVILGVQSLVFTLTGVRLLPTPLPLIGIFLALVAISLPVIPLVVWLRSGAGE